MSIQSINNNIQYTQRDIENLQKQYADENRKEHQKTEGILRVKSSIKSNTSPSMVKSKLSEIERNEKDIISIQRKRADISKKISEKTSQLHKYQQELFNEQQKEQKKFQDDIEKKRKNEQRHFQSELQKLKTAEFERQDTFLQQLRPASNLDLLPTENQTEIFYDVFISHASEDKEDLVRPLAEKLSDAGLKVWYDEFQLKVGDKLRRSIDKGLSNSRFGIVVFSPDFFQKNWTQYELDGLVQKEMSGEKAILPLWHKVSKDEVMKFSPSLADTVALNTAMLTIDELVEKLSEVLK